MKLFYWKILFAVYTFGILLILGSAYSAGIPHFIAVIPYYDLLGHFFLYGMWSFLAYQAFSKTLISPFALSLLTVCEELFQITSANRTFSLIDLFFSLLGIWLAVFLIRIILKNV